MASYNRVVLVGNLTRTPELKYSTQNLAIARTGLAVNRKFKEKEEVMFIDIVVFGKPAETLSSYATKGSPVLVEGRLSLSSWEQADGSKRSKHEVIVENFQLLGGKSRSGGEDDSFSDRDAGAAPLDDIDDSDIPF